MNLVQSEIRARLRHGLTQTELAHELGLALPTLSNILNGRRAASLATLRRLGIERHTIYTLAPNHQIPDGIQARAPLPRRKREKRHAAVTHKSPAAVTEGLTTERVMVAVKYRLNPGKHWKIFLETEAVNSQEIDDAWLDYCVQEGTVAAPPAEESLFAPGQLYAHLKPINRGVDHRAPRPARTTPLPDFIIQPEAK